MNETNFIFDGERIYEAFIQDISQVTEHQYNIDEIFMMYADWCRRGEMFVNHHARQLFPVIPGSSREEQEEAEDNYVALRNAMINLYCALDQLTKGLARHLVAHAAYLPEDGSLLIVAR